MGIAVMPLGERLAMLERFHRHYDIHKFIGATVSSSVTNKNCAIISIRT